MSKKKIAVVGGGAAGMMAAGRAAALGAEVTLFERMSVLGRKLGITGKGRCNVTNDCTPEEFIKNVTTNGKFMLSAIHRFSPADTMAFFEERGVPLKTERGQRVFPVSDKAGDIVAAMKAYVRERGCRIVNERVVGLLKAENDPMISGIVTNNRHYDFDAVILATGGASYPGTGSTGDGYVLARNMGHTIVPPTPSLVGLCSDDPICRSAMGLTLKNVAITVTETKTGRLVYQDFGEMLFAHFGITGPIVLSASTHMRPMESGKYTVSIDLKPALDMKTLDARLLSDFEKIKNKKLFNAFDALLPSALRTPFVKRCGIEGEKRINAITKEERLTIATLLKSLPLRITGFRPLSEAIVTSGGVSLTQIDPRTMCSKLVPNLYFAGEVMDLDAYTGGFNLQIAFSTAIAAAEAAAK